MNFDGYKKNLSVRKFKKNSLRIKKINKFIFKKSVIIYRLFFKSFDNFLEFLFLKMNVYDMFKMNDLFHIFVIARISEKKISASHESSFQSCRG